MAKSKDTDMKITRETGMIAIEVNSAAYPFESLLYAAHRFSDSLEITFAPCPGDPKGIRAEISKRPNRSRRPMDELFDMFEKELLECVIKLRILKGTNKVGKSIFSQALNPDTLAVREPAADGAPAAPEIDEKIKELLAEMDSMQGEDGEDPLEITIPWEQKHGLPGDIDSQTRFPRGIEQPGKLKA